MIDTKELRRLLEEDGKNNIDLGEIHELLDRLETAETAWKISDQTVYDLTEKVIPNIQEKLEAAEKERDNANAAAACVALQALELEAKLEAAEKDIATKEEVIDSLTAVVKKLDAQCDAAEVEAIEQARLNGMGSEREAALMAKLEAAEKENKVLREALAEKVTSETMLRDLSVGNGSIRASFEGGAVHLLVDALAGQFSESGAENYLEMHFHSDVTGPLVATLQRVNGKTPHQLREAAEKERDTLRAKIEQMEKQRPVAWGAFYFGGKLNGKLYSQCDTEAQIDMYIADRHQSDDSNTFRKAPLYALPGAQPELNLADPAVQKRLAAQWGYVPAGEQVVPVVKDERAAFREWFEGEQGVAYDGLWSFAKAAWFARAALGAPSVPEGWQLVPTAESRHPGIYKMLGALHAADNTPRMSEWESYRAMLAAAPEVKS